MPIFSASEETIKKGAELIKNGGVVAFPTETVYGLGADAFNPIAVAKIFEIKNRPTFDPLIVHISKIKMVDRLWKSIDSRIKLLMEKFWPGPLTIILPKKEEVPDIVTAGLDTVAVRMPSHPIAKKLIEQSNTPIAAPSANPFGYLSPTTADHVYKQLNDKVELIIDGGKCPIGVESTVIDLTDKTPVLLRAGGLPLEELEIVLGHIEIKSSFNQNPKSPGQLKKHYSPKTPIILIDSETTTQPISKNCGYLGFKIPKFEIEKSKFRIIKYLSTTGDLKEAAANLFSILHELDDEKLDYIYVEKIEEKGLGRAIMDRLKKAKGID